MLPLVHVVAMSARSMHNGDKSTGCSICGVGNAAIHYNIPLVEYPDAARDGMHVILEATALIPMPNC